MTSARVYAPPDQNRLLNMLPASDRERLLASAERRAFGLRDILISPNRPIERVYFPTSGIGSVLTVMSDGQAIETGTVGNEGFVGIPILLDSKSTPNEVICQVPGEMLVVRTADFRAMLSESPEFRSLLQRYTQAFLIQSSQSTACNRLHSVDQRCARWLLMTHDRVGRDDFQLTQEFLAMMLGVRRASVTVAASQLQQAGYISYRRGGITVLNREGLESVTCECYRTQRDEFDRLIG